MSLILEAIERLEDMSAPMPNTRAELARLRRMADAYAADAVRESWDPGEDNGLPGNRWLCVRCLRDEWKGTPILHTATCDVAAHLDLPREKGEGDG